MVLYFKDQLLTHEDIFHEITQENIRQKVKWGVQIHSLPGWLLILGEEYGELVKAALEYNVAAKAHVFDGDTEDRLLRDVHDEAIQLATLSLKIAEMTAYPRG